MSLRWQQAERLRSKIFSCGYCNNSIASEYGYIQGSNKDGSGVQSGVIYICHQCFSPTFFDERNVQTPGVRTGENVQNIDEETVKKLYDEARDSYSKAAYTASVLCCRKLLMHIAVSKGAETNQKFIEYVEYLSTKNYIPPDATPWVDYIRQKGNEANHEIVIMSEEEARDLISFVGMLLKLVYEFPNKSRLIGAKSSG